MRNLYKIKLLLFLFACQSARGQIIPCTPQGRNLIINPDFEQGYFGFSADFGRGLNNATRCNCATQGWILVAQIFPHVSPACQVYPGNLSAQYGGPNTMTSPDPNHPSNTSVATVAVCNAPIPDHTTGNGFFLTVDPDACAGRAYWRQNLQICPNTNYYFSVWVRNFANIPAPTFHFEVDGIPITTQMSYPDMFWVQTEVNWNSGSLNGAVALELINDLPGCVENDVAIDDLFFGVCADVDLSCESIFRFCSGDPSISLQLSGHATGFLLPQYQWQFQAESGGSWMNLVGKTDSLLTIHAPTKNDAGLYRLLAAEYGNIESISCSVFSSPIRLDPFPEYYIVDTINICKGESYAGQTETGLYVQRFQTILGCDSTYTLDLRVRGEVGIYVPNIFSPNDDGTNDQIQPFMSSQDIDFVQWQIFDRWGNLVFESRNPTDSWDGTYRGKPCPAGVYAYQLDLEILECQQTEQRGDITLIR